jgi:biotin-dependent carboxylase-like uncharacterized protein
VIEVLAPGPLATVQDRGRPGWAALGVSRSGAADRGAAALANRLVGNGPDAAVIEATLGGLWVRFGGPVFAVLTGAPCPAALDGGGVAMAAPFHAGAGAVLRLGLPPDGVRTYLAVHGGIDVAPVLGSRATDVLTGLGPPPLAVGARLAIRATSAGVALPGVDQVAVRPTGRPVVLRVVPGPRLDWFADGIADALAEAAYEVAPASNRTALRLAGPALRRRFERELPSEGLVPGAVQVPPDGRPVVFLVDHPVTGGYPVPYVVCDADLDRAAQLRPGDPVRFRPAPPAARARAGHGRVLRT